MTDEERKKKLNNIIMEVMRRQNGGKETRYEVMNRDIKWNKTCTTIVVCVIFVIASMVLLKNIL